MNKNELISKFKQISKIKKGGQKIVYKAINEQGETIALKLIYSNNDPRVLQEIEILKALEINNVPKIKNTGYFTDGTTEEEVLYIEEEFISGKSLRDILDEGKKLKLSEAVKLLDSLLDIEIKLEEKSLIHRDIKPDNIMINDSGQVYLIDFGLARNLNGKRITNVNATHGPFTPGYAPNEQIGNQRMAQDVRTDLFEIGVTIYEACTGKNPFIDINDNIFDIANKTITLTPPNLSLKGDKEGLFGQLVNMLMAKNQSQRPESAIKAKQYLNTIKTTLILEEDL